MLALTKDGEVSRCRGNGIIVVVQELKGVVKVWRF